MQTFYHRQVLQRALGARVSARVLAAITRANLGQDGLSGLLSHPEYHFDDNLFAEGLKYIEDQRALAVGAALQRRSGVSNYVLLIHRSHHHAPPSRPARYVL